jgi:2-polyprenyl-6-methoxyphenol hydroxylase-like FAD-dependent oxidoreductase/predicted pyridoxine 5'-phosphate oxidase superfamily flavin-nucleotide-binding protein
MLVELTDGEITNPRIIAENVRSMEFCRRWGISKDVTAAGFPSDYPHDGLYVTSLTGHLIARVMRPEHGGGALPSQLSPERAQRCHQGLFDPILRRLAYSFPSVELRYRTEFESFEQTSSGVNSQVRNLDTGKSRQIRSQYLVACCGGRSGVRQALGITMEGDSALGYPINIVFRTPELWKLHDKGKAALCYLIGSDGVWSTINSVNGYDLWRISLLLRERTDPAEIDVPAIIEKVVGRRFDYEVLSAVSWVQRAIVADRYGSGRVFIAGDCAHQNPPDGGLGMNTGLGDAIDIAWKLAALVDGWGADGLLSSYEIERRPIAQRNVAEAVRSIERRTFTNVSGIEGFDAQATDTRRRCAVKIERETAEFFRTEGVALGYRYENSPICWPDATPAPPDDPGTYIATTRPGHRVPHAWVKPGVSTLDLFGRGYTLMHLGQDAPDPSPLVAAARQRHVPLRVFTSDNPELGQLYERNLVLVRPDGHAAWRSNTIPDDCLAIIDSLRGAPPAPQRIAAGAAQAAVNSQWTAHTEGSPPMPVKISESWVSLIGNARAEGVACLVATANKSGEPLISPKGSVLVYDDQTLAYWERSLRGAKNNLGENPNIMVYYRNPNPGKTDQLPRGAALRFHGRAEIVASGPVREEVMTRVIKPELDADPDRKGVAVLVHIEKITDLAGNVLQQR